MLNYIVATIQSFNTILFYGAILAVLEFLRPAENQSIKSRIFGVKGWSIYFLAFPFYLCAQAVLMPNIPSLIVLDFTKLKGISFSAIGAEFLSIIVFDFFYYWFHRSQHKFSFLWRFHKTHHSISELNAVNSYHHFTEEFFRLFLLYIPLKFFIQIQLSTILIGGLYGSFIHTNTKLNFGYLGIFFNDPRHHRLHHSIDFVDFDCNFAAFFPVWDILFGTYRNPGKKKVRTGLK